MTDLSISYNDLNLSDANGYLVNFLNGLDGNDLRISEELTTDRSGGNIWNILMGMRNITIEGKIVGETASDFFTAKRDFYNAFSGKDARYLTLGLWNGDTRRIPAKVVGLPQIAYSPEDVTQKTFRVDLKCELPYWESTTVTSDTAILDEVVGVEIPTEVPFSFGSSNNNTLTINNTGDINYLDDDGVFIEAYIYGNVVDPYVINSTTGEFFWIDNTIPSGHYVHIYYDGGLYVKYDDSVDWYRYFKGDIFSLASGSNNIVFTASTYSAEASLLVNWINRYKSV